MELKSNQVSKINELIEFEQSTLAVYEQLTASDGEQNQVALVQIKCAHELSLSKLSNLLSFEAKSVERNCPPMKRSKQTKTRGSSLALVQANERRGLKKLEAILLDTSTPCKLREIVRIDLLPKQKKHVHEIERLMAS